MNFHDKLEEYINNSKNNKKINSNTKENKLQNSDKLSYRDKQESSQFSVGDMNTFLVGSDFNKYSTNKTVDNIKSNHLDSKINTSLLNQKKPTFTESIAYNTRNYTSIVKDCLNFDEINTINVIILYKKRNMM